jgi:hypothetical protein
MRTRVILKKPDRIHYPLEITLFYSLFCSLSDNKSTDISTTNPYVQCLFLCNRSRHRLQMMPFGTGC